MPPVSLRPAALLLLLAPCMMNSTVRKFTCWIQMDGFSKFQSSAKYGCQIWMLNMDDNTNTRNHHMSKQKSQIIIPIIAWH